MPLVNRFPLIRMLLNWLAVRTHNLPPFASILPSKQSGPLKSSPSKPARIISVPAPLPVSTPSAPMAQFSSTTTQETPAMNLGNILTSLITVISILPQLGTLVFQTVNQIEQLFGDLPGAQKFAAAEASINSFLSSKITDTTQLAQATAEVGPLINAAVASFNALGMFKKKDPAATPAAG